MNEITSMTCFSCVVVLSTVAHFMFRRHEPTAFQYLWSQAVVLSLLGIILRPSFFTVLLILLTFNLSLVTQIIFYRLVWHDLRSFPGPKLATISQAWILREAYFGRTRFTLRELGGKYGEWVRIGPNELYTTSLEALYTIMGAKGWPKGPSYDSGITKGGLGGDSVLTIKTLPEHATRRRIWTKAFTPKAIVEYLPSIEIRLDEMISVIDDHVKQKKNVDLCTQLGCFVYNTMCDMAFGALAGTDLLKNQEEKQRILTQMVRVVRQVGIVRNMPWLTPLVKAWPSTQRKEQHEFREFTRSMFLRRRNQGLGTQLDVFHYLLGEDTETGTRLTETELAADSTLLVITGSDTTRTVLLAFFLYILKNPGCMEQLQAELMAAPDLSPPTLSRLPYLNACLQETMRLQPPSPANLQRMCPPGGAVICGRHIPEGTKVRFSNYAIQRDERYFDDPDSFRPQRWLKNAEKEKMSEGEGPERFNEKAFFSFLIGPGACVAKSLAWMEMRLVVATLLTSYDVAFAEGFDPVAFESSWTDAYLLLIEEPFEVTFTPKPGRLR
ncbi:hypothetical protein Pst134EB_006504 [Puccinia striiformis f. sp. tritici]|uniref:Cytochrome P450 67 n=1 Tax=Puccinia striiformis f. sp. tritici PST-78 TaxID=1165861 RepID=A0A0L0V907_9BASI|nr:hypothetical protein Pst134EB_006504 [Puccinia striiformis f. sp. tritici]KNE95681.1 cytochrome P450 67 [Puccinia striiformis f. sp. tritici PST-78]